MGIKQKSRVSNWKISATCNFCHTTVSLSSPGDLYAVSPPLKIGNDHASPTYHCRCTGCNKPIRIPARTIREEVRMQIEYSPS